MNKNNVEKKINDCINFYKTEYENLIIECQLSINENIAFDDECVYITGVLKKEEDKEVITIEKNNSC
jgi:hypothetical protein